MAVAITISQLNYNFYNIDLIFLTLLNIFEIGPVLSKTSSAPAVTMHEAPYLRVTRASS